MSSFSLLVTELQVLHSLVFILPLSLTWFYQVTGQRDEEEIPGGPRGTCLMFSPHLSMMVSIM
jgi:hypothetical protein